MPADPQGPPPRRSLLIDAVAEHLGSDAALAEILGAEVRVWAKRLPAVPPEEEGEYLGRGLVFEPTGLADPSVRFSGSMPRSTPGAQKCLLMVQFEFPDTGRLDPNISLDAAHERAFEVIGTAGLDAGRSLGGKALLASPVELYAPPSTPRRDEGGAPRLYSSAVYAALLITER